MPDVDSLAALVSMVQSQLKEIHDSVQSLREDVHAAVGNLGNKVVGLEEWRKSQEQLLRLQENRIVAVERKQTAHGDDLNYLRGAYGAVKILGSAILGIVALAEAARFFLPHSTTLAAAVEVQSTGVTPGRR